MNWQACILAALLAAAGSWYVRSNIAEADIATMRADNAKVLGAMSDEANRRQAEELHKQQAQEARINALDAQHHKELEDAKTENDRLRDQLRAGTVRVRVPAHCPADSNTVRKAGTAASLADGARSAELDPAFAQQLAGITGDGDKAIRKLNALQEYVRAVLGAEIDKPE